MNTEERDIEIRRLLEGWYEATLTRDEEAGLLRLMTEAADTLPTDLISERDMLLALHSMPRHDTAREKSRERLSRTLAGIPSQRSHRRWSVALGATLAAACVACILLIGFGNRNTAPTTSPSTASRLTAATASCDTIPERIIRLATDTLDIVASAPKIVSSKVRAHSRAAIAAVRTDAVKECFADTTRIAEVLRRQRAEDAETMQLLADILTTVQGDYTTTLELMDDINTSYSSAVSIPTNMKVKFENKPLPAI